MRRAPSVGVLVILLGLIPSIGSAPSRVPTVASLAPVELVADGLRGQVGVAVDQAGAIFVSEQKAGNGSFTIHVYSADLSQPNGHIQTTRIAASGSTSSHGFTVAPDGVIAPPAPADVTPPTTTAIASPGSASGWNNTDVRVTLSAVDHAGGSGVKQIVFSLTGAQAGAEVLEGSSASVRISAEGVTILTYFATDNAGNAEAPKMQVVRIDKTPPIASATVTPQPNAAGWNNTNVTVTFAATDSLSGIASVSDPVRVTAEGKGQVIRGTATDVAGNSASASVTLNIDKTPPELTARCALVAGRDSLSGVDSVTRAGRTTSKKGKFKGEETFTILDRAGNRLEARFRVKAEGREARFTLLSLTYNGGSPITPAANQMKCEFASGKSAGVTEVEQKLELKGLGTKVEAKFQAEKNVTRIEVETGGVEQQLTRPGLDFLNLITNRSELEFGIVSTDPGDPELIPIPCLDLVLSPTGLPPIAQCVPRTPEPYLLFNGTFEGTSYAEVRVPDPLPNAPPLSVSAAGLSVAVWMRPDTLMFPGHQTSPSANEQYVHGLGKGEHSGVGGDHEWTFRMYSDPSLPKANRLSFYVSNPVGGLGCGSYFQDPIEAGQWIHVVGVVDAAAHETASYKNGELRHSESYINQQAPDGSGLLITITPKAGLAPLRLGTRDFNSYVEPQPRE